MKRKLLSLIMILAISVANSMTAFASDEIQIKLSPAGAIIEDGTSESMEDYESQYAYDGEDYVYAKATFGKDQYSIKRSEFGKLMKIAYEYGTPEENFVAYRETSELEDVSSITKEPVLPEKDTRTPWLEWTSDQWQSYESWVKDFSPDDYQSKLLEYYSATEIFSYYMGLGYAIDEVAFSEYLIQKQEYDSLGLDATETGDEKQKPISFAKLVIQYELDSMYTREHIFCTTEDSIKDLSKELSAFDTWTGEEDVLNPNAYLPGVYFFEVGSLDRHMTDISNVEKKQGAKAYRYLKANSEEMFLSDDNSVDEEYYKIKVCALQKGNPVSVELLVKESVAMKLLSSYLPTNTDGFSVTEQQPADEAKG